MTLTLKEMLSLFAKRFLKGFSYSGLEEEMAREKEKSYSTELTGSKLRFLCSYLQHGIQMLYELLCMGNG